MECSVQQIRIVISWEVGTSRSYQVSLTNRTVMAESLASEQNSSGFILICQENVSHQLCYFFHNQSITGLSWSGTHWVQILSHERETGRHPECTHCQSTYWHVSGNWEETGIAELRTELETLELWDSKCYPGFNERLITTSRTWSTFFMIKILRQEGCNYITYPNLLFNTRLSIWCVRVLNNTFKTDGLFVVKGVIIIET